MIVFFGTRLYGKTDQVPGLFHVATEFFYVQFVPLVPVASVLVFQGTDRGIRLGLSGKSVLFAYLRTVLQLAGAGFLFAALLTGTEALAGNRNQETTAAITLLVGVVCVLLFFSSYRLSRAGPIRAYRLASRAGFPLEVLADYYATRLSPKELDELARQMPPSESLAPELAEGNT
jgi:hypothetical protein